MEKKVTCWLKNLQIVQNVRNITELLGEGINHYPCPLEKNCYLRTQCRRVEVYCDANATYAFSY